MQVSENDLKTAFERSDLPRLGYTFQAAMGFQALVICLKRLAEKRVNLLTKPVKLPVVNQLNTAIKTYWFNEI